MACACAAADHSASELAGLLRLLGGLDGRHQARGRASLLQERVLEETGEGQRAGGWNARSERRETTYVQEGLAVGALCGVFGDALLEEVLELVRPLVRLLQLRNALRRDQEQSLGGETESVSSDNRAIPRGKKGRRIRRSSSSGPYAQGRELHVRGLALGHLNDHDAERPDVNLDAVIVATDQLGGHPVGGADDRVALGRLLGQLRRVAEVGCRTRRSEVSR